ncbi:peptide MFS transporter [Myxococcota bacterium]|nr:peptide MFS transporter [Myxococcota bacterium]MBU1433047.1 peptide MFS transporter [Myxococcota bacterium]MBU1899918.1 peptide MFS transporter [Myxococcota bacterium]
MDNTHQIEEIFGHPKGLFVLFFTEMWERFSYYGMRAILVFYMTAATTQAGPMAGLGWESSDALTLYGWYTMMVYVMGIPGGWLADNVLGQRKAVMFGGLLLCVGHGVMALPGALSFYSALVLIILGVGLLKPNISTMVGGLYKPGDHRRDKGFTLFYIGINLGAFLSSLIVGFVGEKIGWHYGFGLAGIGMLFGQLVFIQGKRHLQGVGDLLPKPKDDPQQLKPGLSAVDKDRLKVLFLSFLIVIVFWGAFEQAGGLMNLYAKEKVNRLIFGWEMPASFFQSANPLFIMIFGTAVAGYWYQRGTRSKEASSLFKMAVGTIIMGLGFVFMVAASKQHQASGNASMYWLILAYLFHTIGELCASPVALSFITKLAPAKYASLMMGAYFAVTGIGNKLAGFLGAKAESLGEVTLFAGITAFCVLFGLLIIALLKPLKRLTHGAEDLEAPLGH